MHRVLLVRTPSVLAYYSDWVFEGGFWSLIFATARSEHDVLAPLQILQTATEGVLSTYLADDRVLVRKSLLVSLYSFVFHIIDFLYIKEMISNRSYDLAVVITVWKMMKRVDPSAISPFPAAQWLLYKSVREKSLSFPRLGTTASPDIELNITLLCHLSLLFLGVVPLHPRSQLERKLQLFSKLVILPSHRVHLLSWFMNSPSLLLFSLPRFRHQPASFYFVNRESSSRFPFSPSFCCSVNCPIGCCHGYSAAAYFDWELVKYLNIYAIGNCFFF